MRSVVVVAIALLCMAGMVMANTPPARSTLPTGNSVTSGNYHSRVSPDIAALQAQERIALANGDEAGARDLENQVQAALIRQQGAVPHEVTPMCARPQARTEGNLVADRQIFTGRVSASSADYEMDGTMWAAFASYGDSTVWVYKSTDHGSHWATVQEIWWPPKHIINKIELVVGSGDSGFVYVFENVPTNNGDLYVARCAKDGSGLTGWAVLAGADSITDFTACRDYSYTSYYLYAIAHNGLESGDFPRSFILRSFDFGQTWAVTDTIPNRALPRMAFGAGSCGCMACVPNQAYFKGTVATGFTHNWSSPGTWYMVDFRPDTFRINDAAIAPAFTTPPESANVWLAYTHNYNGTNDWDVYSAYMKDPGVSASDSWVGPTHVANTTTPEAYVDLKNYASSGNAYVNLSYVKIDTVNHHNNVWLGYSVNTAPTTWTALSDTWVNKSGYPGYGLTAFPRIVYSPGGPGSGGGLIFPGYTYPNDVNGYFNAPWFNGAIESPAQPERPAAAFRVAPSVARGPVRVSWSGSATRLAITDVAGRIVRSIAAPAGGSFVWDGKVAAGTYLVCLTTTGTRTTTRPVVIQ
ncbi:MAG TPA: hypothetical protein VMH22_11935 [bacterium]|nr:hypothetical protein [bacterium]